VLLIFKTRATYFFQMYLLPVERGIINHNTNIETLITLMELMNMVFGENIQIRAKWKLPHRRVEAIYMCGALMLCWCVLLMVAGKFVGCHAMQHVIFTSLCFCVWFCWVRFQTARLSGRNKVIKLCRPMIPFLKFSQRLEILKSWHMDFYVKWKHKIIKSRERL
jgi:hypothetical protein